MAGRYVVGMDGSRPARLARSWAEEHAAMAGAECLVVHVDEGSEAGRARREPGGVIVRGTLPDALAGAVRAGDVLVVGTGKTGFVHGRVYGSLSLRIAMLAPCTVAVVPDVDVRYRSGVVAGLDRPSTAVLVARAAAGEASSYRTPLQLIASAPETRAGRAHEAGEALGVAERAVRDAWPALVTRARMVSRPPAEALLDAARNARLLVLGPGDPARIRAGAGGVAHDVLTNANAPVLVVRSAELLVGVR